MPPPAVLALRAAGGAPSKALADSRRRGSPTFEGADARLGDALERSPLFGAELAPIILCNGWTVAPGPVAPLTALDSPPLLFEGCAEKLDAAG